jgi:hypothetical protein
MVLLHAGSWSNHCSSTAAIVIIVASQRRQLAS